MGVPNLNVRIFYDDWIVNLHALRGKGTIDFLGLQLAISHSIICNDDSPTDNVSTPDLQYWRLLNLQRQIFSMEQSILLDHHFLQYSYLHNEYVYWKPTFQRVHRLLLTIDCSFIERTLCCQRSMGDGRSTKHQNFHSQGHSLRLIKLIRVDWGI